MTSPKSSVSSSPPNFMSLPLALRFAIVVLVAGLFTLIVGGAMATIQWLDYSHIASMKPELRTAESLASKPARGRHLLLVKTTPQATTRIRILGKKWTMYTVKEASGVVFLAPGKISMETRKVLVQRDSKTHIPSCKFRTRYLRAGTPSYRVHDPRPQAAQDAALAGWTASFGWPLGFLMSLVGFLLIRRDLRKQNTRS